MGLLAVIVAGSWGLNSLFQGGTKASPAQVRQAERYVGYPLRDCHVATDDPTSVLCVGRGHDVRIDFTSTGRVSGSCIVGSTPDCTWHS